MHGKRVPNLGTSAFMGADYSSDASPMSGWRKYPLPQTNRLLSSDPADYAYLFNGYTHASPMQHWGQSPPVQGQMRKLSNTSQPDINHYRTHSADYVDPNKSGVYSSNNSLSNKKDSETNTEQSHLMEASMRRVQQQSGGGQGGFGYRRPLSNTSTSSAGSNKSNGSGGSSCSKSSTVGSRLAKHGVMNENNCMKPGECTPSGIPRPGSAASLRTTPQRAEDLFTSATLERKKKGINGAKTNGNNISPPEELYKSNTLGRNTQKKSGSKASLTRTPSQGEGTLCAIILLFPIPMLLMGKMKWEDLTCIPSLFPTCHKTVCQHTTLPWNMEVLVIRVQVRVSGLRTLMETSLCICQTLKAWTPYPLMLPVFRPRFSRLEPWVMPVLVYSPTEWTTWAWPGQIVWSPPNQTPSMLPINTLGKIWPAPTRSPSFQAPHPLPPPPLAIVRIPLASHILWLLSVVVGRPWAVVGDTPTQRPWIRTWSGPTLSPAYPHTVAWPSPRSTRMRMEVVSQSKFLCLEIVRKKNDYLKESWQLLLPLTCNLSVFSRWMKLFLSLLFSFHGAKC